MSRLQNNLVLLKVFGMTQPQITSEITNSQLRMEMEVERGTFIVPSFEEIWPQGKGKEKKAKRMGMEVRAILVTAIL